MITRPAQPNVLFIMTDQQRFDTIAALGNADIYTPNLDRLVRRGITFTNGYSTCPVCMPARCTIRTGCEPPTTRSFTNTPSKPAPGQAATLDERCGLPLAGVMRQAGYRTFGMGKFHDWAWNPDQGFDVYLHCEGTAHDDYHNWLLKEHSHFAYIEDYPGERTEMYYMPQCNQLPAHLTVESWMADRAIEQIKINDPRPYFGFVSFMGPHPPFAPPIPFNRLYDPDRMSNPMRGQLEVDHMDDQIPWMNYAIWAQDINDAHTRVLKARYYGMITYLDQCIGRILDAVEARPDADNTLICFYSDHGDHLGDHHAWQKESYFEQSCHVPFLLSWPASLPAGTQRDELVCLTDLFGIATTAARQPQLREGVDVLGGLAGTAKPREALLGYYGEPGSDWFKIMVRRGAWKYIFMANGGREQLFDLANDPAELNNLTATRRDVAAELRKEAVAACRRPGAMDALEGNDFKCFLPFTPHKLQRYYMLVGPGGINQFPNSPKAGLEAFAAATRGKS